MPAAARGPSPSSRFSARPTPAAEARLVEKDKLSAAYLRERRKRIDVLCEGEHGAAVKELIRFMRGMTLRSGKELLARIQAAEWAHGMSPDDRHLLLSIIGGAIRLMREREGLPPLDDPMFDQPPNVFQQAKAILRCA